MTAGRSNTTLTAKPGVWKDICDIMRSMVDECQFEREQGRTVCEFWPDNNLAERVSL